MSSKLKEILTFLLGFLILIVVAIVLTTDFSDPPMFIPGASQIDLPPGAQYGVKAAILALAAAAALFGSLIHVRQQVPVATIFVQLMGAISAFACALHWLWSETDGNPAPHLLMVLVLAGIVMAGGFLLSLAGPAWKWVVGVWTWSRSTASEFWRVKLRSMKSWLDRRM